MPSESLRRPDHAAYLSWPELQSRLGSGTPLILPIGSFEQHGPHLPLNTDTLVVEKIAQTTATGCGGLLLPTLGYGAPSRPRSGGGGDLFPSPALSLPTLMEATGAIAEGAREAGCRSLIVLSWHMENAAVLWDALVEPAGRGGIRIILFSAPWDFLTPELENALFPDIAPQWPDDHAGRLETAVMRHLFPDLVGQPPAPVPYRSRRGYDVLPTPPDAAPSTGVALDAREAGAEVGRRCFETIVAGITAAIAAETESA